MFSEKKAGLVRISIFGQMTDVTKKLRMGVTIFHSASLSFSERRRPVDANFGNDIGGLLGLLDISGIPIDKQTPA